MRFRTRDEIASRQWQLSAAGLVLGLVLVGRFVFLKTERVEYYRQKSDATRQRNGVITPRRGEILDCGGQFLARTRDVLEVQFDPVPMEKLWLDSERPLAELRAARTMASVLGMTAEQVLQLMTEEVRPGVEPRKRVIKTDLTLQEATAVRYLLKRRPDEDARKPHPLVGFVLSQTYERSYASGDTSTAILGRTKAGVRNMLRGDGGLEDWGDTILAGSIGWYRQRVRPGERLNPLRPARSAASVQGMDLQLTIDLNIQRICAKELDQCMKDHTPLGATAIVLDPKTGDVLGMVSRPSADLSVEGLRAENLEVMRNRALMAYEPGSVMKPITISLALEAGVLRPDEDIPCTGSFVPGKRRVRCEAHRSVLPAPGQNTPRMIIAKSCNVATGITALRLGARRLHAGLERFGLLRPTGVQLPGDVRGFSRTDPVLGSPSRDDVARVGFGQSITVTPLALATAFGVFANDGVLIRPRIIRSYGYPQAAPVKVYPSDPGERVLSCTVAAEMRDYLRSVVLVGTGKNAAIAGYTTAGKTGTASKVKGGAYSGYVASFIGMAPATKPRVIIAVVVDEPHNGYHGSQAAAPTWGRIAADIMDYLKVPPDAPATTAGPKDRKATDSGPVGD